VYNLYAAFILSKTPIFATWLKLNQDLHQQDIQDHQYLHLLKGLKAHGKILSLFFAVMYGKGVALSDTLAIKSDDLLNNHLATIILVTPSESMAQYQMIQLQLLQQELLLYRWNSTAPSMVLKSTISLVDAFIKLSK
jgi:hypothetical protein